MLLSVVFVLLVTFWGEGSSIQVFCQRYFRDKNCAQVSSHKCQIADPIVPCFYLSTPSGYKCNSSGVFDQRFKSGCGALQSEAPLALNPALGQCSSTTFTQNGDGFFINTCPSIAANNLILKYSYFNFPTTYNVPTCTQPDSLNLIPDAYESGTCYTLSLGANPTSISYTCSGGTVTQNSYTSSDCSSGVSTKTFNTGGCFSDNTQAPYADGFAFTCGTPTRSPTSAPTTGPPSVPTSPPPLGAPTPSPNQRTWDASSFNSDFNSRKFLVFNGGGFTQIIQAVSNSQLSGGVATFNLTVSPTVADSDKPALCDNIKNSINNNYDNALNYLGYGCTVSSPKKRQGTSTAVVTVSDTGGGPGSPNGGGLSGVVIGIIVASVIGGIILIAIVIALIYYISQKRAKSGFNEEYKSF